jgi:hypothetical protein
MMIVMTSERSIIIILNDNNKIKKLGQQKTILVMANLRERWG